MPELTGHIWEWFNELSGCRQNGMGINPISHMEIEAWSRLTGNRPASWEVAAIRAIDAVFIASVLEDQPKPKT